MVAMPAVVVLIVCKVAVEDRQIRMSDFTGSKNLQWGTEDSML
jgi:hypothetical protein